MPENDLVMEDDEGSKLVAGLAIVGAATVVRFVWKHSPVKIARRNRNPRKMVK